MFNFWKADQSSALLTIADNALGAEFTVPVLRVPILSSGSAIGIGCAEPTVALEIEGDILASGGLKAGGVNVLGPLSDKISAQQLSDGLATKQATVVDDALDSRHVRHL